MKRCIAAVLLVLSLEALAAGSLSAAVADDRVDTIRLPSNGIADEVRTVATERKRPWECCDVALCTRSRPPTCRCFDQVEQCAATCKSCEPATSGSSRLVCNDWYQGFPGPKCKQPGAAKADEDVDGNGQVSSEVAGHHEAATAEMAVSEETSVVDGEKPRPWKCCDQTLCTRSAPPTCFCHDKVKRCAKTCKNCLKDESGSSLHMCGDPYFGWPEPKCHKI